MALAAYTLSAAALCQTWRAGASLGLEETATNNVHLDSDATRKGDFVTQITPGFAFSEHGTHTTLAGVVSLPVVLYARTGAENNNIYPSANILGDVAIGDVFHVEGTALVTQQLFSPFGAQPTDFSNVAFNRYRTQTFTVSPYFLGTWPGGTRYELRNNNGWTMLYGAPLNASNSNSNYTQVLANLSNEQQRLGYRAHYDWTETRFADSASIRTQLARVGPVWTVDPQTKLLASVGYEVNDYQLTSSQGVTYGGGIEWNPTERTKAVALYEHRFFGSSYLASFAHRTPLSEWSISASRNITTYPQQLAAVPAGLDVAAFLNNLFLSSIPDPIARQNAVNQLIQQRGLPPTLVVPVSVYSQQILLQQQANATVALIGARNTILFTVYNVRNQPITAEGSAFPAPLGINNDNTQTGGSVVWNMRLSASLNLATSINAYRTVSNNDLFPGSTRQAIAQVTLSTPLGPRTTGFVGGRYQVLRSDVTTEYNEAAVMVGVAYTYQ